WNMVATTNVRAIADDPSGALWLGTDGAGLLRVDTNGLTSFTTTNGLPGDHVSSLWADAAGILLVATSRGLRRYYHGQSTSYDGSEHLVSDSVGYLIGDTRGNLWLGSRGGVMRVLRTELNDFAEGAKTNPIAIRVYEKSDGLPSSQCTQGSQPAACQTRDGK